MPHSPRPCKNYRKGHWFKSNADYSFSIYDLRRDAYVARLDPATRALLSPPTPLQPTGKSSEEAKFADRLLRAMNLRNTRTDPTFAIHIINRL